ncbi:MAG: hypothetical protein AVDCRST_MAG43-1533 [uncultured Thermomicrobiales bacterium]|uniref:Uncharacterized protein n=1 Tax=uncultured Thermomicrobiales bacterium TaxID=1645740 RepID=A0A6J4USA4_9BACT|nr:MAG: hypothetical protein AVDCRST_MAG43-1533 [uncultured Thermomicrobiales bacterium]
MRLVDLTVGADDVRQGRLGTVHAASGFVRERPLGIVERLAVELEAGDRPLGPEVRSAEPVGDAARGRTVGQGEQPAAEVDQDPGVVVGIGRDALAIELALGYPHTGDGRHLPCRAEHRGQAVQRIDGHVVERAAARLAEVPGWVDVGKRALTLAFLLVEVVGPEGGAGDRPGRDPDPAFGDRALDGLHLRPQHLARGGDDPEILCPREVDQLGRLGTGGRHRLVEVDVLASLQRLPTLLEVQPDRRRDRHRVDITIGEQVFVVRGGIRNPELRRRRFRPSRDGIADRLQDDAVPDVLLAQVRQDAPLRDRSRTNHTHLHHIGHAAFSMSLLLTVRRCFEPYSALAWGGQCPHAVHYHRMPENGE